MNITMTVTASAADELFSTIKGMAVLIREDCPAAVPNETTTPVPSVPQQAAFAPPTTPPPATSVPTAAPNSPPTSPTPSYTLDQLNRAGADLITAHPDTMPQLSALMAELGVQTLAQLKPEMYGTVALRLRELGASI